jgi:hypothetical protein
MSRIQLKRSDKKDFYLISLNVDLKELEEKRSRKRRRRK